MQKSVAVLWTGKEILTDKKLVRTIGIMFFLTLTTLGAFVYLRLPFTPVPLTLQTFFVLLSGAFLRRREAIFAQASYLGLGLCGLPIFSASGAGLTRLFGPTGGYLVGFIFSAVVVSSIVGFFARKGKTGFIISLLAMFSGIAVIYFFGALWLGLFLKYSFSQSMLLGVLPFIPGDILKIFSAAIIFSKANSRMANLFK